MSFAETQIDQVQKYWDRRTCNIRHSPQPVGTKEYFDDRGLAQRNCALAGGPDHLNSIQDAPYEFHGLGVKHKPDRYSRTVRAVRSRMWRTWFALLNATRRFRHAIGLPHENLSVLLAKLGLARVRNRPE